MNPRSVARASLLLNLFLLGIVAYLFNRPGTPTAPAPSLSAETDRTSPEVAALVQQQPESSAVATSATGARPDWRQIESSDYETYRHNLRAIGCPEQTIRDIITADVNKLYAQRKAALYLSAKGAFTFWATDDHTQLTTTQSAELNDQLSQIDHDKHAFLEQLFGSDFGGDPFLSAEEQMEKQRRLAFLPEAKQNQLRALEQSYPDIDNQIHALVDKRSSMTDPQELQQLLNRYTQKEAVVSQLLSPEELEQYELSTSWTADNLRRRLSGFEPTEDEFRTIFDLWRAHDEALAAIYATGQPEPGNLDVYDAIAQFLGPERNAQYLQAWGGQPVPPAGAGTRGP